MKLDHYIDSVITLIVSLFVFQKALYNFYFPAIKIIAYPAISICKQFHGNNLIDLFGKMSSILSLLNDLNWKTRL